MPGAIVPQKVPGRIDYVDNLRIFLTALVVCHHQWIAFGAPGGWYYVVRQPAEVPLPSLVVMTMFVGVNQAFFMSLFFFVAAYFTPMSLDKRGRPAFFRKRLMRLGVPLLVFFFLLNPSVVYLALLFSGRTNAGYLEFMAARGADFFGPGPMWFVLSLILFTAVYLGVTRARRPRRTPTIIRLPGNYPILAFILVIGAITFLVRLEWPVGTGVCNLQLGYFPLYICMFAFGIIAYRHSWLEQLTVRQANHWFYVALAAILGLPVIFIAGGATEGNADLFNGGLSWQAYAYAAWEPFVCVGISMKLLVFFRKHFNQANNLTARLSKSSYTVYIFHPFFVVGVTQLFKYLPLPPLAVLAVACPVVLAAVFVSANAIRQAPVLNKVL